jgi:hypothetical protein
MSRPRIVLTMIVKDEAHVIGRCIEAVRPVIDAWCIVDTGSSDATEQVATEALDGLPGHYHHRPWVDFAHNRSEALELARPLGEFSLMIDADVVCDIAPGATIDDLAAELTGDHHDVELDDGVIVYDRPQLTSTALDYAYSGVLHEFLVTPEGSAAGPRLSTIRFVSRFDGARSRNPDKFNDDVAVFQAALATETDALLRRRYQFYLAESLRSAGRQVEAIDAYRQRATLGGWNEEAYVSLLWVGRLLRRIDAPLADILDALTCAHDVVPTRSEALCEAAEAARIAGRMPTAWVFASAAAAVPRPASALFLEPDVYQWRATYELSIAAWYVGEFERGAQACAELLAGDQLPSGQREAVEKNLRFYET